MPVRVALPRRVRRSLRRGKIIESQELEPYNPAAGSHLGQYAAGAAG